jgi:hypothetical protein
MRLVMLDYLGEKTYQILEPLPRSLAHAGGTRRTERDRQNSINF